MDKSSIRGIDKDLIQGLTEKEVQVEHLNTVIHTLGFKLASYNDIEQSEARNWILIQEGTEARAHLQVVIQESAHKTSQRAEETKDY